MIGKNILRHFLNLFFPPLCVCCENRLIEGEKHICLNCLFLLPIIPQNSNHTLEDKFVGYFQFSQARSFCSYEEDTPFQKIIHAIKYKKNKELAFFMGAIAANNFVTTDFFENIELLIPIPLHPKRHSSRTFNQAEEICKGIASLVPVPIDTTSVKRTINNKSQTKLSKNNRSDNVKNIFTLENYKQIKGKHILIVDDVITTGATINSLVSSIPKELNVRISVFSLGNTR